MNSGITRLLSIIGALTMTLVLAMGVDAFAASPKSADPDPWMTDRYEIEIIVFRHRDQSRNTPEKPAPGEIDFPALGIYPSNTSATAAPYIGPYSEASAQDLQQAERIIEPKTPFYLLELDPQFPDFVPLADDRLQLGNVVARLTALDAYEPLIHQAWLQAARPADATQPLEINSNANGDYVVAGTIRLYKERYAHLEIDLDLRQALPADSAEQTGTDSWPVFGDVSPPLEPEAVPLRSANGPSFKLQESRRIRGSNAQYFDHPQFGVIARITAVKLDED
jgi:hypothetical protein